MTTRIMHVDLDAFFVEVCRQRHPEVRDVELLVVGGRRDQRGVVQSASYAARAFGIRAGMPIAEAVRRCPQATFFQGAFAHYRAASRAVRDVLAGFSPTVVMASLDEGYLDFTGTDRLYPVSLLPVAEALRDAIQRDGGLASSVGIGPNRMVAKLASDSAKPRGLMEVRAGWETGFLAGTALHADQLPRSVSRETTLSRDLRDPERLERILGQLTAHVASQLREERLVARTVTLKLRHDDFRTVTRRETLPEPTDLDGELYAAARVLFRGAFAEVRGRERAVRLIGIAASNLATATSPDLFESEERARQRRLTRAVDAVRERFGFEALGQAMLVKNKERER